MGDHLLAARSRRLRGQQLFQRHIDKEVRALRERRRALEHVLGKLAKVKAQPGNSLASDDDFFITGHVRLPVESVDSMRSEKAAYIDMMKAAVDELARMLAKSLLEPGGLRP